MSRIIDSTRKSMGWSNPPSTRNENQIRRIGIHHTAGPATQTRAIFETWWRSLGWAVGGYHEIIYPNGDVEICYVPTTVVNGVGDHNADSYHISLVGNFRINGAQPSSVQMKALFERIRFNMSRFNIPIERVLGHNEFANTARFNHRSNTCPGQDMNHIRNQIRNDATSSTPTPNPTPAPPTNNNADTFVVTRATGGFNTATDAKNNRNQRTTVQPGTYHVFNRANGMINVTRTRGVPGSWINPTGQGQAAPAPASQPTIRVGSRVRVNQNARTWATGQSIPSWVRGQTYTVQQLRNNNNELLLAGVMSWIRRSDVTVV